MKSPGPGQHLVCLAVIFLLIVQPLSLIYVEVMADAPDWGESIGNVMLTKSWGHGSTTNITTTNLSLTGGVFKLDQLNGWSNLTNSDYTSGSYTNTTLENDYKIKLAVVAPSWSDQNSWDLPMVAGYLAAPTLGDIDADGDLDVYVGEDISGDDNNPPDGDIEGFNNTGSSASPSWTAKDEWNLSLVEDFAVPSFADLDNDGDLDMMVGDNNGISYGYNNTGNSTVPQWTVQPLWNTSDLGDGAAPNLGDLDGDGDYDMMVGLSNGDVLAMNNTGSATWPKWTRESDWDAPSQSQVANPGLGDLDGDGDPDLLVGIYDGYCYAYENLGMDQASPWSRESDWDPPRLGTYGPPTRQRHYASPDLGDLDDDGDLDLLVGDSIGDTHGYKNDGTFATTGDFVSAVVDAGHTVNWSTVSWTENKPTDTDVTFYTRSGNTSTPDGTWSSWSGGLSSPLGSDMTSPPSRYLEVKATLVTADTTKTPTMEDVNIKFWYLKTPGTVETDDLIPQDLVKWGNFTNTSDPGIEDITFEYSLNGGSAWTTVPADGNMSSLSTTSGRIRFRATLTSSSLFVSPELTGMDLTYMVLLDPHHMHLSPTNLTMEVGTSHQFTAELHDINNNTLNRTLSWTTTVGSVDGTGNLTARTTPGSGFVNVTFSSVSASARISLVPGPLASLNITPAGFDTAVGSTVQASARGYDRFGNQLEGLTLNWSSDVGTVQPATAPSTNLTVQTTPGSGNLTVSSGAISTSVPVSISPGPLANISVEPSSLTLNETDSATVSASGSDSYGNGISNLTFNWSTDVGTVAPSEGSNTTFTAQEVEDNLTNQTVIGSLNATCSNISAGIGVTVLGDVVQWLHDLSIEPVSAILYPYENVTFNVTGLDQWGDTMNVSASWSSDLGTMSPSSGPVSSLFPNVDSGNGTVTATVGELSVSANVTVRPNETVPLPEIVSRIPDQSSMEDGPAWKLDLNPHEGGGLPDDDLRWHLEGLDTDIVRVAGEYGTDDVLTFEPVAEAHGDILVTYILEDGEGNYDTQDAWINVTPVDDPPVLTALPDLVIRFDDPYTFNHLPYIIDSDTALDGLSVEVTSIDPQEHTFEATVRDFNITYTGPEALLNKTFSVTVTVTDGTTPVSDSISVTVTDNYVPELLKSLPDVVLMEGETKSAVFDLDDFFLDKDKDVIFFSYGNRHVEVTINDDHTVDIASSGQWNGRELVTFRATDSKGALVEDDVLVTVLPYDDAPIIEGVPDLTVHYGKDYYFDLTPYISDVDTGIEDLVLSFSGEHTWWAWDPERIIDTPPPEGTSRLTLVLNLPQELDGKMAPYNTDITITVSDGTNQDSHTITVEVTDNWPPEISTPLPDVEFDEDTVLNSAFDLTDHFIDRDGMALEFEAISPDVEIRINDDLTVDIWAPDDWYGPTSATFRATDQHGAVVEDSVAVNVRPINDPPVIDPIPHQSMDAETLFNLDLEEYIHDVDDEMDDLTIDLEPSVLTMSIFVTGAEAVIFANEAGNFTLTLKVTDSGGSSTTRDIQVDVAEKDAPVTPPDPGSDDSLLSQLFWPLLIVLLAIIGLGAGVYAYRTQFGSFDIEEAFVILRDGRLIAHLSKHPAKEKDETLFSSMVAAVQMFIDDTFQDIEGDPASTVQKMEYKGNTIIVERGKRMYLAVLLKGNPGSRLVRDMNQILGQLEENYGEQLESWEGDVSELKEMSYDLLDIIPGGYSKTIPGSKD